jgi:hypothetical protein
MTLYMAVKSLTEIVKQADFCYFCGKHNAPHKTVVRSNLGLICGECAELVTIQIRLFSQVGFDDIVEIMIDPYWGRYWEL